MALRQFGAAAAVAVALALATPAHAVTEIQWWHAMTGGNNDIVDKLAEEFNASQSDYKVVPTFKGGYPDTMNAGIAAFRAGTAPHIIQVFEVGTATMMAATGAIKPVYQLMKDAGEPFDPKAYPAGHHRLLLDLEGRHAVVPFQLLVDGDVDQQGRAEEGERRDSEDLARNVRRRQEAEGGGSCHLRLLRLRGHWAQYRAALRLAQRAARQQGERPRRFRHRAGVQRAAACQASREP